MDDTYSQDQRHIFRGELALLLVIIMNSFGVVLMLYSGSGISAISSVPYAFSEVFPFLSLGTWTYIFQAILIASLMVLRKRFVAEYLLSFVVGFAFSMMLDVHEGWISILPYNIPMRILYFVISYLLLCLGIALSNRCGLPIIPTDLFPRELSVIKIFKSKNILRCHLFGNDGTDYVYRYWTYQRTWYWNGIGSVHHGKSHWNHW